MTLCRQNARTMHASVHPDCPKQVVVKPAARNGCFAVTGKGDREAKLSGPHGSGADKLGTSLGPDSVISGPYPDSSGAAVVAVSANRSSAAVAGQRDRRTLQVREQIADGDKHCVSSVEQGRAGMESISADSMFSGIHGVRLGVHATGRVDEGRHTGIHRAHEIGTRFHGAKHTQREMLPGFAGVAEPGVVGDVDEQVRVQRAECAANVFENIVVADQRPDLPDTPIGGAQIERRDAAPRSKLADTPWSSTLVMNGTSTLRSNTVASADAGSTG